MLNRGLRGIASPCSLASARSEFDLVELCRDSAKHASMMAFAAPSLHSPLAAPSVRTSANRASSFALGLASVHQLHHGSEAVAGLWGHG